MEPVEKDQPVNKVFKVELEVLDQTVNRVRLVQAVQLVQLVLLVFKVL